MGFFTLWRRWGALPRGMRRVAALSTVTAIIAAALIYQTNVRSQRPPTFSRGGPFAAGTDGAAAEVIDPFASPDASATPAPAVRSQHTLSAPGQTPPRGSTVDLADPPLPRTGRYTYAVDGYEEATGFGRRDYPDEMKMTVHRTPPTDPGVPPLEDDEIVFDLVFSAQHEEREIVSHLGTGVSFTYEAGSVTFGPVTQDNQAVYEPPMLQVPFPLDFGVKRSGASQAKKPDDGSVTRTEDWTIEVLGRETLEVMVQTIDTWVVKIERQTRRGSSEQLTRTRQYWFDTTRMLWVKWTETLHGEQPFGPGTFTYDTEFTATLSAYQPLS